MLTFDILLLMHIQLPTPEQRAELNQFRSLMASGQTLRTLRREEEHIVHIDSSVATFSILGAGLRIILEQYRREGYILALSPNDALSTTHVIELGATQESVFVETAQQLSNDPNSGYRDDLIQLWQWIIAELTDNISEHARTPFGVISSNANTNGYSLVIADGGISIPVAYRTAGISQGNDCQDVKRALHGQSTKTVEERGTGLPTIKKIVTEGLNGSLALFSGNASLRAHDRVEDCNDMTDYWPGTIVAISVPYLPSRILNLYDYLT